jgi:hypothetical protein
MDDAEYWNEVAGLSTFRRDLIELTARSVADSIPAIERSTEPLTIPWNAALFNASLVNATAPEFLIDASLRVTQGCIQDQTSSAIQRTGARVLLERMGNRRSVTLAIQKDRLSSDAVGPLSAPIELDLIRREIELTVDGASGVSLLVNDFQQRFWYAAEEVGWLSVSAPTSVGKSFIVRSWIKDQLLSRDAFTAVYLVPTRALIEEVSNDLRSEFPSDVAVFTMPWDEALSVASRRVLVLTQERLHILQQRDQAFSADLLFIDEAQKFGDGSRGLLLQRVVDEAALRNTGAQVIFASPLTSNPELLVEDAPASSRAIASELVTVNQNLIYVESVPHKGYWNARVVVAGQPHEIGTFTLPARANTVGKRLPLVAVALGGMEIGNVVYANGQAEAEKMGQQIFDALGDAADLSGDSEIEELRELIRIGIHPQYALRSQVRRGVAFHYGNMPLLVREAVESLFRSGKLRYLICTSTLLEGVNLPCRNLFVRAPRKGNGNPMSTADFWNLAGRAGRWGMEFQGNIVCVDTTEWTNVPAARSRQPMRRATDTAISNFDQLLAYVQNGSPPEESGPNSTIESLFSFLAARIRQGHELRDMPWLRQLPATQSAQLQSAIVAAVEQLTLPESLTSKHAGISPTSIQRLVTYFTRRANFDQFSLLLPESRAAADRIYQAMGILDQVMNSSFGSVAGRYRQLSILVTQWMRGMPLAYLVNERVSFKRERGDLKLQADIRGVMNDVETIARFRAPLYLACYVDALAFAARAAGTSLDTSFVIPDIAMMLELGVSRVTDMSMMSLGLSRTSVVILSEYVVADELSPAECRQWLAQAPIDALPLPELVRREIHRLSGTDS